MEFGDRLKEARSDAGLTGEKLGEKLGVSKQTIAHWEANRYEPKLVFLAKLSEVLDVSVDWLVTGKSVEQLSPAAVKQGRFYDALSHEGRRRWETAKLLIREGVSDAMVEKKMPVTAVPPMNMGGVPDTVVRNNETNVAALKQPDTDNRHVQLNIPGTGKTRGAKSDQRSTNPDDGPSERREHAPSATPPSRTRKT